MYQLTPEESRLCIEYKKKLNELSHVVNFNKKIKYLNLAWDNYNELIDELRLRLPHNRELISDEYYTRKAEMVVSNLFSIICEITDFLKNRIVETAEDGKITNRLKPQYKLYQGKYDNLLNRTIDRNNLIGWPRAFRNVLLHSGSMMFGFLSIGNAESIDKVYVMCDYELIDDNENFKSLPLKSFFRDRTVFSLWLFYQHNMPLNSRGEDEYGYLLEDIGKRTSKIINIPGSISKQEIGQLLQDETFLFHHYNQWRTHKIPSQGTFWLNLTELLEGVYQAYKQLYEGLYNIICTSENEKLKELNQLAQKLEVLYNLKPDIIFFNKVSFSLNCTKC